MNLRIKIVLSIMVSLLLLISIAGFSQVVPPPPYKEGITGRVMAPGPETNKDVTDWIPVIDATLTLTDSEGDIHTVTTGEDGYYIFTNVAVDAKCVITATATVNGKTMVFKDVIPQPVAADEFYDAGTADTESTALALIVEKLIEQGLTPEDINLEEIQASDSFKKLVEQVSSVLEEGGDITTDPDVTEAANNAGEEIIDSSDFEVCNEYDCYDVSCSHDPADDKTTFEYTVWEKQIDGNKGSCCKDISNFKLNFGDISWNVSMTVDEGTDSYIKEVKENEIKMDDLEDGFKKGTITITFSGRVKAEETGVLTIKTGTGEFDFDVCKPIINDDATLSDLTVDGETVTDFISSTYIYTVELPYGTTLVPEVEATLNDINASVTIDQAINLTGSEEQRTATVLVTAEDGTTQKTYTVVFTVGVLDHIVISPDYTTITAGETQTYTAEAFDVNDNTLGDVTAETSFVIQAGAGGSWTDNTYTSETAGISWIVTGTYSEKFDTAALTVTAGTLDHVRVDDAAGGLGSEVTTHSMAVGQTFTVYAVGYDTYGNYVSDESVDWTGSGVCSGNLSPTTGTSTTFTAATAGDGTITAVHASVTGDTTGTITVTAGGLHHFDFATIVGDKTAGTAFAITITAKDENNNTVIGYSGTNTLSVTGNTISPTTALAVDFTAGVWAENVTLTTVQTGAAITITEDGTGETGTSNTFNVVAGGLHHFDFATIVGDKTAGTAFAITITAKDENNNTVIGYSGTNTLSVTGNTISPTTALAVDFTAGVWAENVTLTTVQTGAAITITEDGTGETGTSNTFNVVAGGLHHFDFATIVGDKTAGTAFAITITAKDENNNTVIGYSGTNTLSVTGNTISPTTALAVDFTAGVWAENVTLTTVQTGAAITITEDGTGETGTSNTFNVVAGGLHHFDFATIVGDKTVNVAFAITITAKDENNNTVIGYSGTNTLSVTGNTISPTTALAVDFTAGVWAENVTLTTVQTGAAITITEDGTGETGTSNTFNVVAGGLHHFDFATIVGDKTAGTAFAITITAKDENNNTVIGYSGTNTLSVTGNTISPTTALAVDFTAGVWAENVTLTTVQTGAAITITEDGTGETGTSNTFNVVAGGLHHFDFATIVGDKTAGTAFAITITAKDENNNTVIGYSGTNTLSVTGNTISPTTALAVDFTAGVWAENVTLTTVQTGAAITITEDGTGETGTSNTFNVVAGGLHHFDFATIVGDKTAGTAFAITITAKDENNNTVIGYSGTNTLSVTGNTISPTTALAVDFTAGVWAENVTLTTVQTGAAITITEDGTGETGTSNTFNVVAGGLHHFDFATIVGDKTAGTAFAITITAKDENNNTVIGYSGTNTLSVTGNTISPTTALAVDFTAGVWAENVTLTTVQTGAAITITEDGTGETGTSNTFNVVAGGLHHFDFATIVGDKTAGTAFAITITAKDENNNTVIGYSGTNTLSVTGNTISPTTALAVDFTAGVWAENVTLTTVQTGAAITITEDGTGETGTSNTFNVVAGGLHHFDFATIVGDKTVNVAFAITITAKDENNNTVIGYSGTNTLSVTGNTISPTTALAVDFTAGVWAENVTLTTVQTGAAITITEDGTGETGTSNTFNVVAGGLHHFDFATIVGDKTVNVAFAITITAKDENNNTVIGYSGTNTLSVTGNTISPTTALAVDFTAGVWAENVTLTTVQTGAAITITEDGTGETGTSNTFNVVAGGLHHFDFATIVGDKTAGTAFAITITAKDENNNTVIGYSGTNTLSVTGNTISPTTALAVDFTAGVWAENVTLTTVQTGAAITITEDGTGETGTSNTFNVVAGGLHHFDFATIVGDKTAGTAFAITITAKDENNNTVIGYSGTNTLSVTGNTISPTTALAVDFTAGVWAENVTLTTVQTGAAITITEDGTGETGTSNTFNVVAGGLHHFDFATIVGDKTAGTAFAITITAKDENNNTVIGYSGTNTLSVTGNTISPTTALAVDFTAGVWAENVTLTTVQTGAAITITEDGTGETGTSNTFNVVAGGLHHFDFATIVGDKTAGTAFAITITAKDENNNTVIGYSGTNTLSVTGNTISPTTALAVDFTAGVWAENVTLTTVQTGAAITITEDGTGETGTSNTFNVVAGGLHHFDFATIVGDKTAGTAFAITITAKDENNNTVIGYSGTNTLSVTGNTISPTTALAVDFTAGVWAENVTLTTVQTGAAITITEDGTGETGTSNTFNVVAGGLHHFDFATIVGDKTVNVAFAITITAKDENNNTVIGYSGTNTLSVTGNTISPTTALAVDFTAGVWAENVTLTTVQTGAAITITEDGTGETGTSNTFNVVAGGLHHFDFATIVGDKTVNVAFAITITAKDENNNTVIGYSGTNTLSVTGNTISPTTALAVDFTAGVWAENVTLTTVQTGAAITITEDGTGETGTSNTFNVVAGGLHHFDFATIVGDKTAGTAFAITITAKDENNNTVIGYSGTNTLSVTGNTISPTTALAVDFTAGVWAENVTLTTVQTGAAITITEDGTGETGTSNTFNVVAGGLHHFDFATIVGDKTAGTAFAITITAKDENNNTVIGYSGTNTLSVTGNTISPTTALAVDFTAGVWAENVTLTTVQTGAAITITEDGTGETGTSNTFNVVAGGLHHFDFATIVGDKTVNVAFAITITAKDENNNTVIGYSGTNTLSVTGNTISPTTALAVDFTAGVWAENVTLTTVQTGAAITITEDGTGETGTSNTFNVVAGGLHHFDFATIVGDKTVNVAFAITITAKDENNNTVIGYSGTNTLSVTGNTISPTTALAVDFTAGVWAENVTLTTVQTGAAITITEDGTGETGTSNTFNVVAGGLHHFDFATIVGDKTAGTAFAITITAKDENNNTVIGYSGTNTLSVTGNTISPTTALAVDFTAGVWAENVTLTTVQTGAAITITEDGTGETGTSNTFNVVAGGLHHFDFATIVGDKTAGTAFAITITAKDENNNTVIGYSGTNTLSVTGNTISPTTALAVDFTAGVWAENVTLTTVQTGAAITITEDGTGETGTSNTFNVVAGGLHHFDFATIVGDKTVNVAFAITITAKDENNNTVIGYSGTNTLSVTGNTISPTTALAVDFTAGVWAENVTLTTVQTGAAITITEDGTGETGTSNTFNVVAGGLHHFDFATISSPQTAGVAFSIIITAKDVGGNTVTDYTETNTLSVAGNTISPTSTTAFSAGEWTGDVTLTSVQTGAVITTNGGGKTGDSGSFDLPSGVLDHFIFASIAAQAPGTPFSITITAKDASENTVIGYTGTGNLSDDTGTISPVTTTGGFITGGWTGDVTITIVQNNVVITIYYNEITGASEKFHVR